MTSAPGPLVVGVAELLRRLGTQREVSVSAALDDIAIAAQALYDKLAPTQKVLADARIVTLVAPVRAGTAQDSVSNLPDFGSSGRTQR